MSMYSKFAEWYDQIFPFSPQVYTFLNEHKSLNPGPVLDLGCGTGAYCHAFSKDGIKATGIDLDQAMIETAQANSAETEFFVMDLTGFSSLNRSWSTIFSIGNTMAHIQQNAFWDCVSTIYDRLDRSGTWILQVMNWDFVLKRARFEFPAKDMGDAVFYRTYRDITANQLVFETALRIKDQIVFEDCVTLYPLTCEQIIAGHKEIGFSLHTHQADYSGSPFSKESFSANIFVFEK